ncbi:MAG: hypothetical protein KAG61_11675 [Bacteriovoracaceae bacterium]|nr:hypothetical protein [Bacteriovoracaceae bacterium]
MKLLLLSIMVLLPISSVSYAAKTVIANEKYDKIKKTSKKNIKSYDKIVELKGPADTGGGTWSRMRPTKDTSN